MHNGRPNAAQARPSTEPCGSLRSYTVACLPSVHYGMVNCVIEKCGKGSKGLSRAAWPDPWVIIVGCWPHCRDLPRVPSLAGATSALSRVHVPLNPCERIADEDILHSIRPRSYDPRARFQRPVPSQPQSGYPDARASRTTGCNVPPLKTSALLLCVLCPAPRLHPVSPTLRCSAPLGVGHDDSRRVQAAVRACPTRLPAPSYISGIRERDLRFAGEQGCPGGLAQYVTLGRPPAHQPSAPATLETG